MEGNPVTGYMAVFEWQEEEVVEPEEEQQEQQEQQEQEGTDG